MKIKINFLLSFALLIAFFVTLFCQFPLLINKYAINDDVRQSIYLYSKFKDPWLFNNDLITEYNFRVYGRAMNLLYYLLSLIFDPITFTKYLPFLLCALCTLFMFRIGELLKDVFSGFVSAVLFVFVAWSRNVFYFFGTGNGTDFGILFFIIFLYYLFKKELFKVNILLLLLASAYPPLLLICLLTYLVFSISRLKLMEKNELLILLITFIVTAFILRFNNSKFLLTSFAEMSKMEEFYPGGRKPVFSSSILEWIMNDDSGLALDYPMKWLIAVLIFTIFLLRRRFVFPKKILLLVTSSFAMFAISSILIYRLYGPSRYIRFSLPIALIILIAINFSGVLDKMRFKNLKNKVIIFLTLISLSLCPFLQRYYIIASHPDLYSFLQSLPKDTLIAGHPRLMDDVPTFAKRKVFINEENSLPFYSDIYPIIKKRTYDFFDAYYSDSLDRIRYFCSENKISYLVVSREHFSPRYLSRGEFYLNPFNNFILNKVKQNLGFAILKPKQESIIFDNGDIFVIKVDRL